MENFRSIGMYRFLYLVFFYNITACSVISQCTPPTLLDITARSKDSISIKWNHFSIAQGWELAIYPYGENPNIEAQTDVISTKSYTFHGLSEGTSYAIYLRTVCGDSDYSSWTPIQTSTVLSNPSVCGLTLPIANNSCTRPMQEFLIEVTGVDGKLGKSVYIEKIEFIAEHTWPADLKIALESPAGKETILSSHHGVGNDNYGDPFDTTCVRTTGFSDLACASISSSKPPFVGIFKPDTPLRTLDDESSPNGLWKLKFCDRSIPDIGFLKYVHITFSPLQCPLPQNFVVDDIDGTTCNISWDYFETCNVIELRLRPKGGNKDDDISYSVDCQARTFTIAGLSTDTEYDLYVLSDCFSHKSPESCPLSLKTLCHQSSISVDFDASSKCSESCKTQCHIEGIFRNIVDGDDQDWLVHEGSTQTMATGPDGDALSAGRYVYVEASPDICGSNKKAVLRSSCLEIDAPSECGLSFYHHMYGSDAGQLFVLAYANNSQQSDTIFKNEGGTTNQWFRTSLDLKAYHKQSLILEFVAITAEGERGDIAIDEIKIMGASKVVDTYTYYQDIDLDGYGNDSLRIDICADKAPTGYSAIGGDCDDTNPSIYPGATEIPCNGIDENCDGNKDDPNIENPITVQLFPSDESCSNTSDGSISIEVNGGTTPYTFLWNDGNTEMNRTGLTSGFYRVQITDINGCTVLSPFTTVAAKSTIHLFTIALEHPSCRGISDGQITVEASGGVPPYSYTWSDGTQGNTITELSGGMYTVQVTDQQNCSVRSDTIRLVPKTKVQLASVDIRPPSCAGGSNGQILVDVVKGTPPITYTWDDGHLGKLKTNLAKGSYTIRAVDKDGCFDTLKIMLQEPKPLSLEVRSLEHNACHGDKHGLIKVRTSGGKAPYTYLWNNGRTTSDIYNLPADIYNLTVTDANVCKSTIDSITILEPEPLSYQIIENTASACILSTDGQLIVGIQGGKKPYTYHWNGIENKKDTLVDITSGKYTLTLIDENQCKLKIENIDVKSNDNPLKLRLDTIDVNTCFNDSLSIISVEVEDAAFPIDYNWSHGIQHISNKLVDSVKNLPPDTYGVTVTDAKGCVGKIEDIRLKMFVPMSTQYDKTDNTCFGDKHGSISLKTVGGTPPYAYTWTDGGNGKNRNNLENGIYTPIITDADGCMYTPTDIEINSPQKIDAIAEIVPSGSSNTQGSIKLQISGGSPPYNQEWQGDIDTDMYNNAINLATGYYQVRITDKYACEEIIEFFVPRSTSTADSRKISLSIYPNPSHQYCTIETEKEILGIQVYDLWGHEYHVKSYDIYHQTLVHNLPPGLYMFRIKTNKDIFFVKHVVF